MESFRNRLIKSWNHLEPFVLSFTKSLYNHLAMEILIIQLDYCSETGTNTVRGCVEIIFNSALALVLLT